MIIINDYHNSLQIDNYYFRLLLIAAADRNLLMWGETGSSVSVEPQVAIKMKDFPKVSDEGIGFETMMIDTTAGQDAVVRDGGGALTKNENEPLEYGDLQCCCSDEYSRYDDSR